MPSIDDIFANLPGAGGQQADRPSVDAIFSDMPGAAKPAAPALPQASQSPIGNFASGAGIAFRDLWNGLKQRSLDLNLLMWPGIPQDTADLLRAFGRLEVAKNRITDRPVLDTTAGRIGNVTGNVAAMLPTAFVPGANTIAGAAAIGGLSGLLQPSTSDVETAKNAVLGAVTSPAALLAGRGIGAAYQGAKSVVAPFTESGQQAIVGRTLNRFAGDPAAAAGRLSAGPLVPGSSPTVAELAGDGGLAQLQRSVANSDPRVAAAFAQRGVEQNAARVQALREIAGDEGKRAFFDAFRRSASGDLYGRAFDAGIDPSTVTPAVQQEIASLMQRPSVQAAVSKARDLAAEGGTPLTDQTSLQGLHYLKLALDDAIGKVGDGALGNTEKRAVTATREKLLGLLDQLSPLYAEARSTHQAMSRPLNQMDVGQALLNKLEPALAEHGALARQNANAFAQALRDPGTAARATGFKGATLESVLDPQQLQTVQAIAQDLARRANAQELGRAVGSNTAQNLVGQNLLEQVLGPLGLPQSWATSTVAETLANRPISWLAGPANRRIQDALAEAMLDPTQARALMLSAQQPGASGLLGAGLERLIAPITAGAMK